MASKRTPANSPKKKSNGSTATAEPQVLKPARSGHIFDDSQAFETRTVKQIIKLLEHCTVIGRRPDDVFTDWLELVNALLEMEPKHEQALAETGKLAPDPQEVVELLARLRKTYPYRADEKQQYLDYFLQAFAELRSSTIVGYMDIVGLIYMQWGWPHKGLGQYFTPMSVTTVMARLLIGDGRAEVHGRLKAAIEQSPAAQAALLAGSGLEGEVARAWFIARVIPSAIEHYTPVTVYDPCVGSGAMLLASASCFDDWMNQLGLVQYFGQDLDGTCVLMGQINLRLYGLNGHGMRRTMLKAEAVLRQHGIGVEPEPTIIPFPAPSSARSDQQAAA